MAQINVTIDKEGNVSMDVRGVKGRSCQDLTKQLEQALGKTVSDRKTPEFYQTQQQERRVSR